MIIAPYIYDDNIIEFTKNKTGFGIMVQNIVSSVCHPIVHRLSGGRDHLCAHRGGRMGQRAHRGEERGHPGDPGGSSDQDSRRRS